MLKRSGLMTLTAVALISTSSLSGAALLLDYSRSKGHPRPIARVVRWRIGNVDSRFKLSKSDLREQVGLAINLWEAAAQRTLFVEDNVNGFPINLVFDSRQKQLNGILVKNDQVGRSKLKLDQMRLDLARRRTNLQDVSAEYEQNRSNTRADDREDDSQDDLRGTFKRLNLLQTQYNLAVSEFNSAVNAHNKLVYSSNGSSQFSQEAGECEMLGSQPVRIQIYVYKDRACLKRTLAHELGHALRLEHVRSSKAIMNASSSLDSDLTTLTDADRQELARVLQN